MKIVYYLAGVLAALAGTVYLLAWKSPPYYPVVPTPSAAYGKLIPFASYGAIIDHPRPMIVRGNGFVLFGAEHTRDPDDAQIDMIISEWNALQPTVALVEGRLGFLLPGLMDPVRSLGEGGIVRKLAGSDGTEIYNWDLSKESLAAGLRREFEDDQIALAQILNPYFGNRRFGRPGSPEGTLKEYLHRASYVGREAHFQSPADVDTAWNRYFPDGPDWRDVSDEYGLPGYLDAMATRSNDLRNRQLLAALTTLLQQGERVFVIAGSSHAACLAPALQTR